MIKYGLVSRDHVRRHAKAFRSSRSLLPFVAFTLFREIGDTLSEREEKLLEIIYAGIPGGGILKGTKRNRYSAVDSVFVEEIDKLFPADQRLRVHDMAASSAVTSLEFFERLKHRKDVALHATDFYDALYVVKVPGSGWEVVFDAAHRPIQFVGKRLVIQARPYAAAVALKYPVNWLVRKFLTATLLPKAARLLGKTGEKGGESVERIPMFHPECVAAAKKDSRFTLGRDDIFDPKTGPYEVVRVMGVVRFLPPDQAERMFRAVARSIVDGGLLILSSFEGELEDVRSSSGVFQRCCGRFTAIRDIGEGLHYRKLLLGLDLGDG